ncbi:MAG: glycosyltransferase family 2 protein [Lachnospiraceae bacterium]|nr:glycosyltransferase family 2 protein [Lachnospiraceae bacterium]
MEEQEYVSLIIPIYNEEHYIVNCIESLFLQDYPSKMMEWIFVDGGSTDKTREILGKYEKQYSELIKVLDNPYKTVPYAMNIGIDAANGEYIIRLDAHADYEKDYISKCVYYLEALDADNVGGVAETKSKGIVGNAIAKALSSKFGVGNSSFRTEGKSGYVDTVPFGAFRREIFNKVGRYDTRLTRNQDNELNYRIRKNGGKIYMSDEIRFSYYCRDNIKALSDMAMKNGKWNVITMKLCPGSMGIRHFIPLAFVLSLVFLVGMGFVFRPAWWLLLAEVLLYLLLNITFSVKLATTIKECGLLMLIFPIFHITYGIGSLNGVVRLFSKEYRKKKED